MFDLQKYQAKGNGMSPFPAAKLGSILLLIVFLPSICCKSHSPLGYDAILVMVIIELFIAFAVGILCIIFSCNLYRAVKDSETTLRYGDLPPRAFYSSKPNKFPIENESIIENLNNKSYQDFERKHPNYNTHDESYDMEYETESIDPQGQPKGFLTIMESFTEYLRLW